MLDNIKVGDGRRQLPEEVAGYVRELIISGQMRPGEFVRMEPITKAMGVSNTPVREGLLLLCNEGFVDLVPRRGFVVASFGRQDVHDLFWVQATMAGELAARAAVRISDEALDALDQLLDDYAKAAREGDEDRLAGLGHDFHRHVNLAAESPRLTALLGSVVKHLTNRFYTAIEGHVEGTLLDHPAICEALRARKPEKTRQIMERHILSGADRLIASLENQGLWVSDAKDDAKTA